MGSRPLFPGSVLNTYTRRRGPRGCAGSWCRRKGPSRMGRGKIAAQEARAAAAAVLASIGGAELDAWLRDGQLKVVVKSGLLVSCSLSHCRETP
jgi:hypothetical protein